MEQDTEEIPDIEERMPSQGFSFSLSSSFAKDLEEASSSQFQNPDRWTPTAKRKLPKRVAEPDASSDYIKEGSGLDKKDQKKVVTVANVRIEEAVSDIIYDSPVSVIAEYIERDVAANWTDDVEFDLMTILNETYATDTIQSIMSWDYGVRPAMDIAPPVRDISVGHIKDAQKDLIWGAKKKTVVWNPSEGTGHILSDKRNKKCTGKVVDREGIDSFDAGLDWLSLAHSVKDRTTLKNQLLYRKGLDKPTYFVIPLLDNLSPIGTYSLECVFTGGPYKRVSVKRLDGKRYFWTNILFENFSSVCDEIGVKASLVTVEELYASCGAKMIEKDKLKTFNDWFHVFKMSPKPSPSPKIDIVDVSSKSMEIFPIDEDSARSLIAPDSYCRPLHSKNRAYMIVKEEEIVCMSYFSHRTVLKFGKRELDSIAKGEYLLEQQLDTKISHINYYDGPSDNKIFERLSNVFGNFVVVEANMESHDLRERIKSLSYLKGYLPITKYRLVSDIDHADLYGDSVGVVIYKPWIYDTYRHDINEPELWSKGYIEIVPTTAISVGKDKLKIIYREPYLASGDVISIEERDDELTGDYKMDNRFANKRSLYTWGEFSLYVRRSSFIADISHLNKFFYGPEDIILRYDVKKLLALASFRQALKESYPLPLPSCIVSNDDYLVLIEARNMLVATNVILIKESNPSYTQNVIRKILASDPKFEPDERLVERYYKNWKKNQ